MEKYKAPRTLSEEDRRRAGELALKVRFLYFEREEAKIELMRILKESDNE